MNGMNSWISWGPSEKHLTYPGFSAIIAAVLEHGTGEEAMKNRVVVMWVVAMIIPLVAMPAISAEQGKKHDGAKHTKRAERGPITCPREIKTGEAPFDAFMENIAQCKMPPTRHWYKLWQFWERSRPAVTTKKISKGPIASVPYFL
jgi:hypothetical protein